MSFVLALGWAFGVAEHDAFAQASKASKTQDGKATEDPAKTESVAPKSEETDKKTDQEETKEETEKKPLDTSVESPKAIYFSGDISFTRSDLGAISDGTGFDRTVANGFLYGLSTGLRLHDWRFGVRWRVYDTTEFTLWTFALSAGYALPLRPVSPVFSAHVGYIFDQNIEPALFRGALPAGTVLPPNVEMNGLLAGVDVNASYWVTRFFRLGAFIGADLMFLHRAKAPLPQTLHGVPRDLLDHPLYAGSDLSVGLNVNLGLRGAFDIAFQ